MKKTPTYLRLSLGFVFAASLASCEKPTAEEFSPSAVSSSDDKKDKDADKDQKAYQEWIDLWSPLLSNGRAGGGLTVNATGADAFNQPAPGLDAATLAAHQAGDTAFFRTFELSKLAPIWVQDACSHCHVGGGRAAAPRAGTTVPQLLFRVSMPGSDANGAPNPVPGFGTQIQPVAVGPNNTRVVSAEGRVTTTYVEQLKAFADGTQYSLRTPSYSFGVPLPSGALFSPRTGPQVAGLGLLEAVAESSILTTAANQNSCTTFGITGRPNYVWDVTTNSIKIGRFGWKANQPNLLEQNTAAYNGDLGVTTSIFPIEPDGSATVGGGTDITDDEFNHTTTYTRTLGVPALRNTSDPQVVAGKQLFMDARCAVCHVPVYRTGTLPGFPQLSNQIIYPFTDLLLHDMGPGLADNRPDFQANGSEWRTPPLWGLGLTQTTSGHTNLLHDGRARNVMEAIMWHDGEGAYSRQAVEQMNSTKRAQLLAFLNSL